MSKLSLAVASGLLFALQAAAHAQSEAQAQGANHAENDHSAQPPGNTVPRSEAMPAPMMKMGRHMEACCCPCCKKMAEHGGKAKPQEESTPKAAPEQHQH